ncbi:MAG: hypothetical protein WD096_06240 [Actinomycetota bacterium]
MTDQVSFRAVYERFPAAMKGAFVLRGADGEPHQVRIDMAWVRECAGRSSDRIGVEPSMMEIAPTLDTFVPFEVPILDMEPGWYRLEVDAAIDGIERVVQAGQPFAIGWPRGAVRRGSVDVGRALGDVTVRSVECAGDRLFVAYEAGVEPVMRLAGDGQVHPVLEVEHDPESGGGRVVAYPALREHAVLSIDIKGADPVEVRLP